MTHAHIGRLAALVPFGLAAALAMWPATSLALTDLTGIASIKTNGSHSCALMTGGTVMCWGSGPVGDGTNAFRNLPVPVVGISGATRIAVGYDHACAVTSGGGVKCWGSNIWGQIGDNSFVDRTIPADVVGLASGVQAIAAGIRHTCALTTGGAVKCWGQNRFGQLGDNAASGDYLPTPADVSGLGSGVVAIAAGRDHTCAVTNAGGLKCWGGNTGGQLGDNSTTQRNTPVDVSGLSAGVAAVVGGQFHTCALLTSGGAKCWGSNATGEVGDNSTTQRLVPVDVAGLGSGVAEIAAGASHACARLSAGGMKCWGLNGLGQLGDQSLLQRNSPENVAPLGGAIQAIAAGGSQACALMADGRAKCWGSDTIGQLGDGFDGVEPAPVLASNMPALPQEVGIGSNFTCIRNSSGAVRCAGDGSVGQLTGIPGSLGFVPLSGLQSGIAMIAIGSLHGCALTTAGGVKCWGSNVWGQLGDNSRTTRFAPVDVAGLTSGVAAIFAGRDHTCARTTGNGVKCWGRNTFGQLGDNSTTDRLTPVDVAGLTSGVIYVAAGDVNTCAVMSATGAAKCWGDNGSGQLGNNTTTSSLVPVDVIGLASGVVNIGLGNNHACAQVSSGTMKCWGWNAYGQVGDGTRTNRLVPTDVPGMPSGVNYIVVGTSHSCAIVAGGFSGPVKCWGGGGSVGDGTLTDRLTPTNVPLGSPAFQLHARGNTCAFQTNGNVSCWGTNSFGELGNGKVGFRIVPDYVLVASVEQWVRKAFPASEIYARSPSVFANTPVVGQSVAYVPTLGAGIFRIANNGTTLTTTPVNTGLPMLRVRSARGPDANNLIAGLDAWGVYKTTDGGANWTAANGAGAGKLGCFGVRNANTRSLTEYWAATSCRTGSGLFRTTDGGANWSRLGTGVIPDDAQGTSIAFNGSGATTVAVLATSNYGLFRSADNGATWTQINNGIPQPDGANLLDAFGTVFLNNASSMMVYVREQGVFRTTDGGANWSPSGTGLPSPLHSLQGLSRESATKFYIGTDKGPIYVSTDGGLNWGVWGTAGTQDASRYGGIVNVDGTGAGRYYVTGLAGLSRTTDDGASFLRHSLAEGYATSFTIDPDGRTAYVATKDLMRVPNIFAADFSAATDMTATLPGSVLGGGVLQDRTNPATFYVATPFRGLYKSTNAGAAWSPLAVPNARSGAEPALLFDPLNTQVIYAAVPNKFQTAGGGGVYKTVNGGTSWTPASTGLSNALARDANTLAVSLYAPNTLLLGTADGLYRSLDGASTWTLVRQFFDGPTPLPVRSVRFDPVDPSVAWMANSHVGNDNIPLPSAGVWKSVDGGATWSQVLNGRRVVQVRPEASGRVVVLLSRDPSQPAVLASSDGGTTWQALNSGLQLNDGVELTRTGQNGPDVRVVMGSMSTGVYVLPNPTPETSITLAPTPNSPQSVVFTFASTDPAYGATISFQCSLDGAAFTACTSPMFFSNLSFGSHTFQVRAIDSFGNVDPTPETFTWTVTPPPQLLSANPASIDFGGQSMNTSSTVLSTTITNTSGTTVTGIQFLAPLHFSVVTSTCSTLAPAATCQVNLQFRPGVEGSIAGNLSVTYPQGGSLLISLSGVGERSLVTHYYRSILRRDPDAPGKAYWASEAARLVSIEANINEAWFAMAQFFYFSPEYVAFNRTSAEFVTDLYNTFFNRGPDGPGLTYWTDQIAQGMPREVVLASFMFSSEFATFAQAIFGNTAARAEVDVVMDFYRGLLARLPDATGFSDWRGSFRSAQCATDPAAAIYTAVENISTGFIASGEYVGRGRSHAQYVGDLYNALLRRGGDLAGVVFWIDQLTTGAMTRDFVRQQFIASGEFQGRVNAVIAQGCLP